MSFPDWDTADAFATALCELCICGVWVTMDVRQGNRFDPFPYELTPPIVYAPRGDAKYEQAAEALVAKYAGKFAGT
jgi:hypothetical protein